MEIFGFLIGLLYLYWEYQADAKMWIASVVMPLISMWVYFEKGIYADFAINIYYVLIAAYGYWNWTRRRGAQKSALPITHARWQVIAACVVATGLLWVVIARVLMRFTDSTIPWWDGLTTAMSIVALWMGARKYCEQWLFWLVVDVVTVPMQISKGLVWYPVLYTAYSAIALLGYSKWSRQAS